MCCLHWIHCQGWLFKIYVAIHVAPVNKAPPAAGGSRPPPGGTLRRCASALLTVHGFSGAQAILGHLNAAELLQCCQVSRLLRGAASREVLWRRLCTAAWPTADVGSWMAQSSDVSGASSVPVPVSISGRGGGRRGGSGRASTPSTAVKGRGRGGGGQGGGRHGGAAVHDDAGDGSRLYTSWRALYGELRLLEPLLLSHSVWHDRGKALPVRAPIRRRFGRQCRTTCALRGIMIYVLPSAHTASLGGHALSEQPRGRSSVHRQCMLSPACIRLEAPAQGVASSTCAARSGALRRGGGGPVRRTGDSPGDKGHSLYYFRWGHACVEGVRLRYKAAFERPARTPFLTVCGSRYRQPLAPRLSVGARGQHLPSVDTSRSGRCSSGRQERGGCAGHCRIAGDFHKGMIAGSLSTQNLEVTGAQYHLS